MMFIPIDQALRDPRLLGAGLGPPETWATWIAAAKAAFGLSLSRAERRAFSKIAGGRKAPTKRVKEFWAIVGRRAGKSKVAAALAVYITAFQEHKLSPGEVGTVLVLAASKAQADVVLGYCRGYLEASPVLSQEIVSMIATEITLRNGIVISVHAGSFRTVRGRTLLCVIGDEVSYWRDEHSSSPDVEVFRACLPSLLASGGMWIGITTGYRRLGLAYQKHRDFHGQDGDTLVISADSRTLNPTLSASMIAQAEREDPESAEAEWAGGFRRDLANFLPDDLIDGAIDHGRPLELPPRAGIRYAAFVDASAGRHDAFAICIGHQQADEVFAADCIRATRPPFDPSAVAHAYADLAREYGCSEVVGDNFSGEWVSQAFQGAGISYKRAERTKSELYLEGLPQFARGLVRIPDHAPLIRELRLLERRVHRSGRDSVDHGSGGSDDLANCLFGTIHLTTKPPARMLVGSVDYCTGRITLNDDQAPRRRAWSRLGGGTNAGDGSRVGPTVVPAPFTLHRT